MWINFLHSHLEALEQGHILFIVSAAAIRLTPSRMLPFSSHVYVFEWNRKSGEIWILLYNSNRFLRNYMGMVVPHVFHSYWKLAFDQIQFDAYCSAVWRWFDAIFKLPLVIPIFERNESTECLRKSRQPTSIGITWHLQSFSTQSAQCLVSVLSVVLVCFLPVFFPGDSQFYEEDTLLWIGLCYNVQLLFDLNNVNWKL